MLTLYDHLDNTGTLHAASLVTVGGALVGWLPPLATALACVYYIVKIYESATTQRLIARAVVWYQSKQPTSND